MRTIIPLTLAFIFGTIFLKAQEIQNRTISSFNKMEISGNVNVFYAQSDTLALSVKAKTGEMDHVETRVENGTLYVANKGRSTKAVSVYVKNSRLDRLQASGASQFHSPGIKTDSIVFSVSNAADVTANVKASTIRSVQSGASMLTLNGSTNRFFAELSGASSLYAYDLVAKNADILATGASSSKVYVTDKLSVNESGASDVKVKGEVTDISAEADPASSLTRVLSKEKEDERDSTIYNWKGRKIIVIGKDRSRDTIPTRGYNQRHFKHWTGFALGVNGFMAPGGGITLPAQSGYMNVNYSRSFNLQFNLIERQFNIVQNYFKIVTGFGFDYHSYELSNKTTLNADSAYTAGTIDVSGKLNYDKNRLRNTYIQVPLLLEFNTSNDPYKTFHIAFGVIGEYLISSRTRQVLEQNKVEIVRTRKDGYNMSPFVGKAHLNVGYRGWTLFGEYNLTPLFQGGKGPELYPFTVGIRLIPFA